MKVDGGNHMEQSIYLTLENGTVFQGKSFGACKPVTGEVVFTTAMTGYLETLTDPSYYGQMVVHTFPLIGNYGVIPADFESSAPRLSAYIVRAVSYTHLDVYKRQQKDKARFRRKPSVP